MANLNIKLIMIVFSIIAVILVAGFGIWLAISGPVQKQQVKGAATSQEELIRQLEQSVFGDVVK